MFRTTTLDVRYALRTLGRAPGFTVAAVLTLALGIGATTVLFTVVNGVLLRPLPYPDPDRLVLLYSAYPQRGIDRGTLSVPDFRDWAEQSRMVARMGLYSTLPSDLVLLDDTGARELTTTYVSWGVFPTLGVEPALGRVFRAGDEEGDARVVVLSHRAWMRYFGGDAAIVDRTVTLSDQPFRIAGVMPDGFGFPDADVEAWALVAVIPPASIPAHLRFVRFLNAVGRLAPDVTAEQAQQELSSIAAAIAVAHPDSNAGLEAAAVRPLRDAVVGNVETALLVVFGAVGFVLLIACVNVANLLLARGVGRRREVAVRAALGASRPRIVAMLLTEGLVLALLGGALGWLIAIWGVDAIVAGGADVIPRAGNVAPDRLVLAFAAALSILTVAVFGLIPALALSRSDVSAQIKEGGERGTTRLGARGALVAAEVAIALVLLVGAGLLLRSLWTLNDVDPGFRADGALTATLIIPATRYAEQPAYLGFHDSLVERFRAMPGVTAVGSIRHLPMRGAGDQLTWEVPGRPEVPRAERPTADMIQVTPDLFRALGVLLLRGRSVSDADVTGGPLSVVVNDTFARRAFPGEDPIGRSVRLAETLEGTVVGVAGDVRQRALDTPPEPTIYVPLRQVPRRAMSFVIRTAGDPMAVASAVEHGIREAEAGQAISEIAPLEAVISRSVARPRFFAALLAGFAVLAMVLAAIGISGVVLFSVRQRTREIGIRMALGAPRGRTMLLVLRHGMKPVVTGLAAGLVLAAGLTRFLSALLFEVRPLDPGTYVAVALGLCAVGLLATYIPARRAASVDPIGALRHE